MFLHVVGHNQRFRCIKFSFRRSVETISRYFQEVLSAVGELSSKMILPPSTKVQTRIQNSRRWNPYFKVTYYKLDSSIFRGYICQLICWPMLQDCVGTIDGTHVLARIPAKARAAFLGRKHTNTQNVLAVVDFDLRSRYSLHPNIQGPLGNLKNPRIQGLFPFSLGVRRRWMLHFLPRH